MNKFIVLTLAVIITGTHAYTKVGFGGACPIVDDEVCGVNNVTYQNECFLRQSGNAKAYDGWCINGQNVNVPISNANPSPTGPGIITNPGNPTQIQPAFNGSQLIITKWWRNPDNGYLAPGENYVGCPCNDSLLPVCGSNGMTYANMCRAECANIKAVKYGECGDYNYTWPGPRSCLCPFEIDTKNSVCGVNMRTYESKCVADCVDTPVSGGGFCKNDCGCAHYFKPVCGRDGATYDNECKLDCIGIQKLHEGICTASSVDVCFFCEGNIKRVCGTDGITYDNECYLKCRKADKASDGYCPKKKGEDCVCPDIDLPVCGIDEVTYRNECELSCTGMPKLANKACYLYKRERDSCQNKCRDQQYNPVCGSNGKTYNSSCDANCGGNQIIANGPCGAASNNTHCVCSDEPIPVCGVDGRDYLNKCALQCAGVALAWEGPCTMNADQSGALYKTMQVSPAGNYVDLNGNIASPPSPSAPPVAPAPAAPAPSLAPTMDEIKQIINLQLAAFAAQNKPTIVVLPSLPQAPQAQEPINITLQFVNPNGTKTMINNQQATTRVLRKEDFEDSCPAPCPSGAKHQIQLKMDDQMSLKQLYTLISLQPQSFYNYFSEMINKQVVNRDSLMFKGLRLGKMMDYIEKHFNIKVASSA